MYFHHTEAIQWCHDHGTQLQEAASASNACVGIAPEFCAIEHIHNILDTSTIMLGAQNCASELRGAYTGDVSPQSLYDLGCTFCIVGHSEQRAYHGETSNNVAHKADHLLALGLTPIVCVGETQEERNAGRTQTTLAQQLAPLQELSAIREADIYIAYEPRWAIGTGESASNDDIAGALEYIHTCMQPHQETGSSILLYGGSVGPDNAEEIASIPRVDGFLVGSASRDFQSFAKIIHCTERHTQT